MVAALQSRKDALEAMLQDKTLELKQLCIQEAELTGILPPETPVELGERFPIFRRTIGSKYFTDPLKISEKKTGYQLELDAPLNLTNDCHVYNLIRSKDKPEHQYCQYDLEPDMNELNSDLRHMIIKQPHPSYMHHHAYLPASNSTLNRNQRYRHSISQIHHNSNGYNYSYWPKRSSLQHSPAPASNLMNQCYATLPKNSCLKSRYSSLDRRQRLSYCDDGCTSSSGAHYYAVSSPTKPASPLTLTPYNGYPSSTLPVAASHRRSQISISSPVGLGIRNTEFESNQAYPQHNLLYTSNNVARHLSCQSLDLYSIPEKGHAFFHCNSLGRKRREKQWRETSLDPIDSSRQRLLPPSHPRTPNIPETPSFQRLLSRHRIQSLSSPPESPRDSIPALFPHGESESPVESNVFIESSIPLESPKNHTVVEAGKWQPYRETTKPFEMSDFYKYSTKFKKDQA